MSRSGMSLKYKMIFSYGLLIVFAVLSAGTFSYTKIEKYIFKQATVSYAQTLEQFELNIEDKLNTYYELLNQIANNKEITLALSHNYGSPADFSYEFLNTISQAYSIKETDLTNNVLDLLIFKSNDTLPEVSGKLLDEQRILDTWWYKKYLAWDGKRTVNDYIRLSQTKIWFVTDEVIQRRYSTGPEQPVPLTKLAVVKPIILNFESLVGVLEMYIRYEALFGETQVTGEQAGDRFFVADQQDGVIFDSLSPGAGTQAALDSVYLEKMAGMESGSFTLRKDGKDSLILFKRGERSEWTYFREMPRKNLLSNANAVRQFTFVIASISIVISILIAVAIGSRLSRRISILSRTMEQVADLSLDTHVVIDGRDEINKLSQNYNRMMRRIRELVEQLTASQQIQREAEMKALQAQINPHFLYNTLATINWMALDHENEKIVSMVENLSAFYRLSLNSGRPYLTVAEEVRQVQAYMNIQKIRLEDEIREVYEVADDILRLYVPKLILQPFVENAVLHGVQSGPGPMTVTIRGYLSEGTVVLEVEDDGAGMEDVPIPSQYLAMGGYGIRNVHEKIQLSYGSEYGVKIKSVPGRGTTVTITIPAVDAPPSEP
ncbi:sensor histidine kinase [Cohnella sp. GCM10012308]|uniref:cache domain-containing sensor histidine kinase n=1 Tax=Cohnella sp. GCM10012308 TaxID=3317329 RepID=UPI00360D057A